MSKPTIVALLTDFGTDDSYVAEMKGVMLSLNPDLHLVDITHSVPAGDIRRAAYLLWRCHRWLPVGTIFLSVVDPGVGSDRRILLLQADGRLFVAPDNGLLTLIAKECEYKAWEFTNKELVFERPSHTFHGRDIMAPTCAQLALGEAKPTDFGPLSHEINRFEIAGLIETGSSVEGQIISIDRFGNAITNIPVEKLKKTGKWENLRILVGGHQIRAVSRTFSSVVNGESVAYIGSAGLLELAINGGSFAAAYHAEPGNEVRVEPSET